MRILVVALTLCYALYYATAVARAQTSAQRAACAEWHACRDMAVAAAERGDYEAFHDLAWRAVQTGPPRDAALMYLLARAQSLSGRPHDALVMLMRLADMGVDERDALTSADFQRARELPGWADTEARISSGGANGTSASLAAGAAGATSATGAAAGTVLPRSGTTRPGAGAAAPPDGSPAASAAASSSASSRSSAGGARVALPPASGLPFSAPPFAVSGLAYDALSSRFVLADRTGRKLILVDERSKQAMDLVRADSAGFLDIAAVEIDTRRGDLWVASSSDGAGTLHRVQLVSGRPLRAFNVASELGPATLVDLTVAPNGTVFVLDAAAPRLFALRPRATALELVMPIDAPDVVSIAAASDDRTVIVATRDGLLRIDTSAHTTARMTAAGGIAIDHLDRIRRHGSDLIAIRRTGDSEREVMRFEVNGRGTAIAKSTRLDLPAAPDANGFITVSGDDLVYVTASPADAGDASGNGRREAFTAYRVPLP